jgi:hypothetical protein
MNADGVEEIRKYLRAIEAACSHGVIYRADALIIEQLFTFYSKGRRKWLASLRTHGSSNHAKSFGFQNWGMLLKELLYGVEGHSATRASYLVPRGV